MLTTKLLSHAWERTNDEYDESTLNGVFVESVNSSIQHILRNYLAMHPQTDSANNPFQAKTLLAT